jgi:transposase
MIGPSGTVRVMVATKPVDFRKGIEGLATLVREHMKADPFSGAVYVFRAKRAKRADRIKLIFWDGAGLCLFANDLHSYCISLSHSVEDFGQGVTLLACGDSVDKLIPSAALLLRQI